MRAEPQHFARVAIIGGGPLRCVEQNPSLLTRRETTTPPPPSGGEKQSSSSAQNEAKGNSSAVPELEMLHRKSGFFLAAGGRRKGESATTESQVESSHREIIYPRFHLQAHPKAITPASLPLFIEPPPLAREKAKYITRRRGKGLS